MLEHDEIVDIMAKSVKMMGEIADKIKAGHENIPTDVAIKEYYGIRNELKWLCDKFEHSLLKDQEMQWIWKDKSNMSWFNIYDRLSFINRKLFTIL
jgi:hypothetical protein